MNTETSDKLIGYLIKNKHWSPFDMVHLCVSITTSKAVGIQVLRHWSLDVQEFSQRYAEVVDIEPIELRKQGATNRQVGDEVFDPIIAWFDYLDDKHEENASSLIEDHIRRSKNLYGELLRVGVAKECARMILPMATSTTMYLNGSIRSWIFYLEQRTSEHAQKEHRIVAEEIKKIFKQQFPATAKALGI